MAEQTIAKGLDTQKLIADLEKKVLEIVNGTGHGVATLEVFVQHHKPQTTRLGAVQTQKVN